ncbi:MULTISPECIES: hypothetical protein [unclassified Flavobacterium]|jgi:hypothetical protein|uniref:hypothetical protein n=1 Tax=unclassified Flavobacterium TaxID=196869 RepID=UPI00070A0B49|nr:MULTISPECIES: hypothetical protein [unclassified Flavobacterium]KRD63074.1 hypothetical protein ASE40_04625 [Flavobacterium sp. Root935]MDQ1163791.1 hypothetical protein [Flavobacterium sp. SORGH_AS_0622]TDX13710.1 hypothetical protein EDB96_0414 [Flavobacterium sp. S87F.05.LMB.W.Kidney.N]BDU24359.1 hypothetical protein FLGSB24_11030 [Flavobacterium sp. GSB-24]
MNKIQFSIDCRYLFVILTALFSSYSIAQQKYVIDNSNHFWEKVQFGGGLGLGIGSGYTDISVMPSAIYNVNEIVAVGLGLQFGYLNSRNYYESYVYGGSVITLVNPIPELQLSAELEQVRVNTDYDSTPYRPSYSDNFWNTALYLGAGYRTGNVTIGARYDVLYDPDRSLYGSGFMPFVRVYF